MKGPAGYFGNGEASPRFRLKCSVLAGSGAFGHFRGPFGLAPAHIFGSDILNVSGHAPGMPERIIEFSVAIPPEHVGKRHGDFAAGSNRAIVDGIYVFGVEEEISRID